MIKKLLGTILLCAGLVVQSLPGQAAVLEPRECPKDLKSEPEHTMGLRQLSIGNFSVFYVIEGDKVIVTRVLYSASDISKRLSES